MYSRINWLNSPSITTPINDTNLNKMDLAIDELSKGWQSLDTTGVYASADAPTFTMTTGVDTTGYVGVGNRIKLTQTTVKYFIVTAITSTTITLYGGTDYTLANAAITDIYFSNVKSPFGFPMDISKWSEIVVNSTDLTQNTAVNGTWYNLGSVSKSFPIGNWIVSYSCVGFANRTGTNLSDQWFVSTLSTTNNSETDTQFTKAIYNSVASTTSVIAYGSIYVEKPLTLTAKTTYYLLAKTLRDNNT